MNLITRFKSTCFYSIIISFLIFMFDGLMLSVVYMLTNSQAASYFIGELLVIAIVVYKMRKGLIEDVKNLKKDLKGNVKNIIIVYIILMLLMYFSNILLYNFIGSISSNETEIRTSLFASPLLIGISLCLFAPIIEELGFRYPYKKAKTNKHVKYIIYSTIFAMIHIVTDLSYPGILFFIPYFFLSLAIGYGFYKTDNIIASMIAHVLNNTSSIIILLIFGG